MEVIGPGLCVVTLVRHSSYASREANLAAARWETCFYEQKCPERASASARFPHGTHDAHVHVGMSSLTVQHMRRASQ